MELSAAIAMSVAASQHLRSRIAVVVATYKRAAIVSRLVQSLASETAVHTIGIVDNDSDAELKTALEKLDPRIQYMDAGGNLGCGGGLTLGMKSLLRDETITHFWILDDDAVIERGCADRLLSAMRSQNADLAVPLLLDSRGNIGWFPGPLPGQAWTEIKKTITPAQFIAACGSAPLRFVWSPGVSLLVSRHAIKTVGFPRTDYWLMGEDIEFTARVTAQFKAVLVPEARANHLPPVSKDAESETARQYAYVKFCAHLTNNTYTAFVLPHGRRLLRHLPGNYLRFLRENRCKPRAWCDALRCFFWGAVCREPAGSRRFQEFKTAKLQPTASASRSH